MIRRLERHEMTGPGWHGTDGEGTMARCPVLSC